ncbi:MAG: diguanylate cyclase [Nitrospinae bacterium]|nr:diguanylate cyclase [Nitrospinota bacterium]
MGILVIGESKENQAHLKKILKNAGYKDIVGESSAYEAFAALGIGKGGENGAGRFDLILIDSALSGMDSIETCRKIQEDVHLQDIPIVLMAEKEDDESLHRAFLAGAMDYIKKPVDKTELLARVHSLLQLKQERDRRRAREKELLDALEQLRKANGILRRLSAIDGLTGLANRRNFDEFMEKEWRRALRDAKPVSLIMIDIDHFKAYNDTYGHQGGDDCLKKVAAVIIENVKRPADLAARYGGEEFVVVLPDTKTKGAEELAEQLRKSLQAVGIPHARNTAAPVVTISLGVATLLPERGLPPSELVARADKALYAAKDGGRNQVKVAAEEERA